jgi:alkanesulfonate monooxygenase SsuD/methylene tetrahydromethanopterin reductase-like flavin-dependent oxidoreductase (luciferase family)
MARLVANIDHLSGGRFIFGVGVGGAKLEFEALGVPLIRRGAIANEYLAAMKSLWTRDDASFEGKHVSFKNVAGPRPFQSPYPPIWVGGSSDGAIRRAVRHGDAWHPLRFTLEWVRDEGLPRLRQFAQQAHLPVPAFCPRIRLQITASPVATADRPPGVGDLDQVRHDLEALQALGAQHVMLDWYAGDLEATRHHEAGWRMLTVLAERALDLRHETLR